MKILKWFGAVLGVLVIALGTVYFLRTDPIQMISGKRLSGEELPYPQNWSVCNDHETIAVETRVDDPHSVTTICFLHEGELIVPAINGSSKEWPAHVLRDARVRIKVGQNVYAARAERVMDLSLEDAAPSVAVKYPRIVDRDPDEPLVDVWLFRIGPR